MEYGMIFLNIKTHFANAFKLFRRKERTILDKINMRQYKRFEFVICLLKEQHRVRLVQRIERINDV